MSVSLVEETGGPEKNTNLQVADKLYYIMLYASTNSKFELTASVVIKTDCILSCKSNYHAITATIYLISGTSNLCSSFPCQNGGMCTVVNGAFKCKCPRRYAGSRCQGKYFEELNIHTYICRCVHDLVCPFLYHDLVPVD